MSEIISLAVAVIFINATAWYLLSLAAKDASVADIAWGFGFVLLACVLLFTCQVPNLTHTVVTALVVAWGTRLTWHIAVRKIGKPEDWRYSNWRKQWGKWFELRSYFQNFLFQGLLTLIVSASVIVAAAHSVHSDEFNWWQYVGVLVWLLGFLFEVVSDRQLSKFIKTKKNDNQILDTGLWRFSRHPNYFGEVTQWWGLWLIVIALPYGLLAVISPLLITFLIVYVSGVPLLEKKYANNKQYQAYAAKTSILLPWPPKQSKKGK